MIITGGNQIIHEIEVLVEIECKAVKNFKVGSYTGS